MYKRLTLLLCLLMLVGLVVGCSQAEDDGADLDEAVQQEGTSYKSEVIVGMSDSCSDMDPQASSRIANRVIYKMTHSPLVTMYDPSTKKLEPMLAEKWEQNDDTTYTFYLREDVKFHDGNPFTAQDVLFTVERGKESPYTGPTYKQIEEISAPYDYTVVMKLENPDAEWLYKLTDYCFIMLSEEAVTADSNDGTAIGTGPYVLDEFELNDYITMDKFEGYWDAENIKSERFKFRYIPEDSARLVALQNGEIDFCMNPANSEISHIADDPNLDLYQIDGTNTQYFAFNTQKPPFDNQKVRQAIAHAVNKEDIVAVAMEGFATPAKTFWGPTTFGYYDGFEGYDYNPEKAKALLAEAGYADGLDFNIVCINVGAVASEVLQAQLRDIGVNATITEMETAAISSYLLNGEHETTWYGCSFNINADHARRLYVTKAGNNRAMYSNPEVDEKFTLGARTFDEEERMKLYKEIQEIIAEEVPYIPMYYRVISWGAVKGFDGLVPDAGIVHDFSYSYVVD